MTPIIGDLIKNTVGNLVEGAMDIIKKLVPDRDKQLQAEAELRTLGLTIAAQAQTFEHEERMGQVEINKVEAASNDPYVRRARPTIMWICAFGFGYSFVLHPLLQWAVALAACFYPAARGMVPPSLPDADVLLTMLGAILGLGGYRTYEKFKGVAR
jgi:hypothetical protein